MSTLQAIAVSAATTLIIEVGHRGGFLRQAWYTIRGPRTAKTTGRVPQTRPAPRHAKPIWEPADLGTVPPTVDPYEPEQRAFTELLHDKLQENADATAAA